MSKPPASWDRPHFFTSFEETFMSFMLIRISNNFHTSRTTTIFVQLSYDLVETFTGELVKKYIKWHTTRKRRLGGFCGQRRARYGQ